MRIKTRITVIVAVALVAVGQTVTAQADFGVQPENFSTTLTTGQPGVAADQAGGHPDFTTHFSLNLADPSDPTKGPIGSIKDLDLDLPSGFVANPTPFDQCTVARVMDTTGQFGQLVPCPRSAAVGYASAVLYDPTNPTFPINAVGRVYRVKPEKGEAAAFAFSALFVPVRLGATVGPDGKYRIRASVRDLSEAQPLIDTSVTLWGVPADHQGPGNLNEGYQFGGVGFGLPFNGPLPGAERTSFTSLPGRCDAGPLVSTLTLTSWQTSTAIPGIKTTAPVPTGCGQLPFEPTIDVRPTNAQAGQPAGYKVDLSVPQATTADRLSTANLKDAVVTLPKGAAISPPSADGLDACTDTQLKINESVEETCPDASKIGTVKIDTPLLDDPVDGSIYVGQQLSQDPESGEMYRIFLTAKADGVKIKLKGAVKADRQTGQLTASFLDNPQLPFSKFTLNFKGGDRAILVNPTTCGSHETTGTLTSWGGQTEQVSSRFTIDHDCPTGRFSPSFSAGMTGPWAGAFSPFTMTVSRTDADQDLSRINLTMPAGLLGALGSVPLCSPAQAGAGSCPESTRIGSTQVAAGTGARPYFLPGKVYVSGPYKGAPFSLSIVVPAKAGPYDLGTVVVRAQLRVDAAHAQAAAVSDPLPTIVGGVPIHMRMVNVTLDRPGFMFNATSCQRMSVGGTFASAAGTISSVSVPYQVRRCDGLRLQPSLKIGLSGSKEFKKGGHPALRADLSQTFGQAGLKRVKVVLPAMLSLAADNAQALCKPEQAAARSCPEGSIVGHATARTPALHEPLSGPVYFVENTRTSKEGRVIKTLPKLWLKLEGEGVPLDLWASSEIDSSRKPQRLVTTFENVPDAPIASFQLEIDGGKHGILAATDQVCALKRNDRKAEVTFTGQNDGVLGRRVTMKPNDCGLDAVSKALDSKRVRVRVSGLGAGKLTISGKGIRKHSRTIKRATAATIAAKLTRSGRRTAAAHKALRLKVSFNPKAKGKKTVSMRTTVKQAKRSSTRAHQAR